MLQLLVLADYTCQLSVPCYDQFHLFEPISQFVVFFNIVFKHLFYLEPFFLFLLHEKFFAIELLYKLFDFDLKGLTFFFGSLQTLLINLIVQEDAPV